MQNLDDIKILKEFSILYIEDDSYTLNLLKKILNGYFKNVLVANDGSEGLEIYKSSKPDLILTDINMPKLNGLEMSKKIKEINPDAQIAILTAFNETDFLRESVEIGISKYILKPLKDNNLLSSLIDMAKKIDYDNKKEIYERTLKLAAMGEMLSNIAHQWRQPLSVISAHAGALILEKDMGTLTDTTQESFLQNIISQTKYLSQTIDDFRDFFIDTNRCDFHLEEVDLKDVLEKVISLTIDSFKSNNITIIKNLNSYKLKKNKNQIIQALINIFNNAKDAFNINNIDERLFFIDININENKVEIILKDNAGGIKESIMKRIFEPYFTTKHQFYGTGIGLYMTHLIIEKRLYGEIKVSNENFIHNGIEYSGACFKIIL